MATTRDGDGWYAEFRIPFSTLRYGRGGGQRWGLNIARNIRRRIEESFWAPVPRQFDLNRVSLAGDLVGIEAPQQRLLTVTPYLLGSARKDFVTGAPLRSTASSDPLSGVGSSGVGVSRSRLPLAHRFDPCEMSGVTQRQFPRSGRSV